jgi:hypothetical protein
MTPADKISHVRHAFVQALNAGMHRNQTARQTGETPIVAIEGGRRKELA